MGISRSHLHLVVACVIAVAPGCRSEMAGEEEGGIARCTEKTGDVRSHPREVATWSVLAVGAKLGPGAWIQTAADAWARIEFLSGTELRVEPSSLVVLEDPSEVPGADRIVGLVAIRSGEVKGRVYAGGSKRDVVLRTPGGSRVKISPLSGETGVDYRASANEEGDVRLAVTAGRAEITAEDGTAVTLARGQAHDLRSGRLVGEVVVLPGVPVPIAPPPGAELAIDAEGGGSVRLEWRAEGAAAGYRMELAEDEVFLSIVQESITTETRIEARLPKPGRYAWRVRAQDEHGYESEPSAPRAFVIRLQKPDLLLAPEDEAVISFVRGHPVIAFSWRAPEGADGSYAVVVARDPGLASEVVLDERIEGLSLRTRLLGAGEYFWGAFLIRGVEREALFPRARKLTLRRSARGIQLPKKLKWE